MEKYDNCVVGEGVKSFLIVKNLLEQGQKAHWIDAGKFLENMPYYDMLRYQISKNSIDKCDNMEAITQLLLTQENLNKDFINEAISRKGLIYTVAHPTFPEDGVIGYYMDGKQELINYKRCYFSPSPKYQKKLLNADSQPITRNQLMNSIINSKNTSTNKIAFIGSEELNSNSSNKSFNSWFKTKLIKLGYALTHINANEINEIMFDSVVFDLPHISLLSFYKLNKDDVDRLVSNNCMIIQ